MLELQISRKAFITGSLAAMIVGCGRNERYTDAKLQELGNELAGWNINRNGLAIELFADVRNAASLLQGKLNPKEFVPFLNPPLRFESRTDAQGAFEYTLVEDPDDSRKISVTPPGRSTNELSWVVDSPGILVLSPDVLASTVRLPIIAKEASQVLDYISYCQLYLKLISQAGVDLKIINPDKLPTSRSLEIAILASQMRRAEEVALKRRSFLHTLVDAGSFIKVGGILYANWYTDQLNSRRTIPQSEWAKAGSEYAGFLQAKGLIKQQNPGEMFVWVHGQPPLINSPEFLSHVVEVSGIQPPRF